MECILDWDLTAADWAAGFATLKRAPLLQSRGYADALCPGLGQRARRAVVRIDGQAAALMQIQEASVLRRAFHAVILDRGPVWADGYGEAAHVAAFVGALNAEFPARIGRRRRLIPEVPVLQAGALAGLTRLDRPGYQTIWCDLTPPLDQIRAGLRGKWRNMLNKAEKSALTVEVDWHGAALSAFLSAYAADKAARGYDGPAAATLRTLGAAFAHAGDLGIVTARHSGTPVAQVMLLTHGRSATWQAGWVSDAGRARAANTLALWTAIGALKDRGIRDLDLGGVNDDAASGVKKFKQGLSGQLIELAGQYR